MHVHSCFCAGLLGLASLHLSGSASADYAVQVGAYARNINATNVLSRLKSKGFPVLKEDIITNSGKRLTAILVGPYKQHKEADTNYRKLRSLGWHGYIRQYSVKSTISRRPDDKQGIQQSVDNPSEPYQEPAPKIIDKSTLTNQKRPHEPEVFVFGSEDETMHGNTARGYSLADIKTQEQRFSVVLDKVHAETSYLYRSGQPVDSSNYLNAALSLHFRPNQQWEFRLAGRFDGYKQTGNPDYTDSRLDYGESFIRYRGEDIRLTAGAQTILWGRIDEIPPTDRLSVQDMSRFILDELPDRRRAVPAIRFEGFRNDYKADIVWIPEFREAELPDANSIWFPINQTSGQILGAATNPILSQVVQLGSFGEKEYNDGGFGIRLSHTGENLDYAITLQRARQSAPYYELHPTVRASLLASNPPATAVASTSQNTFTGLHVKSWIFGGDFALAKERSTWRFEAAYSSDLPATTTDFRVITLQGFDWVAGVEFYPGDTDIQVNLQLAGHHLLNAPDILDRDTSYGFNGSLENAFNNNRWRAKLRFSLGLDKRDVYLNPEIAYLGLEPHELYLSLHYFDGADGTIGGFHKNSDMITLGWRAKY